jgi:site-specific DNA-methyltransferase (adenine-specific)
MINLLFGDCLERMKEILDGSVDAIICDPPYGSTACDWDRRIDLDLIWDKVAPVGFLDANRKPLRTHELMLVFGPKTSRYRPQKWMSGKRCGFRRGSRKTVIYGKFDHTHAYYDDDGSRYPVSIHRSTNANGKHRGKVHPTQKPVALMAYLVSTYTDPGMTVLDPTMGSGSTGVACLVTARKFIGIESDPEHFASAEHRIAAARNVEAA